MKLASAAALSSLLLQHTPSVRGGKSWHNEKKKSKHKKKKGKSGSSLHWGSSSKKHSKSDDRKEEKCDDFVRRPPAGENPCEGKDPELPSVACEMAQMEQAANNVTRGYEGKLNTEFEPISVPFFANGMCAVNVHWHLGTEHYSVGEFDEKGKGPRPPKDLDARLGFRCHLYNKRDKRFRKEYHWKYCKDMQVGQTYEVHWPHSTLGACESVYQYQTPFQDGVYCDRFVTGSEKAASIGVQAQVFTVVNDERYYYPDLMRSMIVDEKFNMGIDMAFYTGSTTGTSFNNEVCSQYSPITWQVDRKCHLMSASSFDKMCADMLSQRDDMSEDTDPHGSRELVLDDLAPNNHVDKEFDTNDRP